MADSKFGRIAASFIAFVHVVRSASAIANAAFFNPRGKHSNRREREERRDESKKERESIKLFRQIDVPRVEFSGRRVCICTALQSDSPRVPSIVRRGSRNLRPRSVEPSAPAHLPTAARRSLSPAAAAAAAASDPNKLTIKAAIRIRQPEAAAAAATAPRRKSFCHPSLPPSQTRLPSLTQMRAVLPSLLRPSILKDSRAAKARPRLAYRRASSSSSVSSSVRSVRSVRPSIDCETAKKEGDSEYDQKECPWVVPFASCVCCLGGGRKRAREGNPMS